MKYSLAHGQMPSRQDLINSALEEYGKAAGDKATAFETNVADIGIVLGADIGDTSLLDTIPASAMNVADSDTYKSCGTDAKEIVDGWSHSLLLSSGFLGFRR